MQHQVSEAGRIADSLKDSRLVNKATHIETLRTRMLQCQSAQILRENEPSCLPFAELMQHVEMTRSVWAIFPFELQIKLAEAYAQENMRLIFDAASKHVGKAPLEWHQGAQNDLRQQLEALSVNLPLVRRHDASTFHGECVTFGHVLDRLMSAICEGGSDGSEPAVPDDFASLDIEDVLPANSIDPKQDERKARQVALQRDLEVFCVMKHLHLQIAHIAYGIWRMVACPDNYGPSMTHR